MSPRAAALLEQFGFIDVYDYVAGKADWLARDLPIEEAKATPPVTGDLTRMAETCRLSERASTVACRLEESGDEIAVVVNRSNIVLGLIDADDLADHYDKTMHETMEVGPSTFRPDADPADPLAYMEQHCDDHVIITKPDGGLIGIVDRSTLEQIVPTNSD